MYIALFDSGATHSAISATAARTLLQSGTELLPTSITLADAQKQPLEVQGLVQVPITVGTQTRPWKLLVINNLDSEVIIGADFMKKNNVILDINANSVIFQSQPTYVHKNINLVGPMCNNVKTNLYDNMQQIEINAVYKTHVPDNYHVKMKCTLKVPNSVVIRPGSLVLTQKTEIEHGVYIEPSLTKVLRRNRIFVVVTNTNPYAIFVKPSQTLGEVLDTSGLPVLPVDEAKIFAISDSGTTGPIPAVTDAKRDYLLQNFQCPVDDPVLRKQYEDLIIRNHDVFAADKYDLGFTDAVSHEIHMQNKRPIYVKQFRIPDTHQAEIINHVSEWRKQKVIEECSSPYNTPIFCVPKKDGGLRIVQDLREINKAAFEDRFAIRDVQECVDEIGKAHSRIFSTLDMASGFWQQNLDIHSRDYTAFTVPFLNTQFRWARTVMGLHGAPSSFSRLTSLVFRGILNAITYIDDVLTHSSTHEDQINLLQDCFDRMRQYGLKFNIKKCVFGSTNVTYLGFQITEEGVAPAKDKVIAVQQFTPPSNLKEVRAFIGFCNYFRRMVPNFSRMAAPLIGLTKKNSGWSSGLLPQNALDSFNSLKQSLCEKPVIGFSRTGGQYILTVDAATTGLGAILSQISNNEETIVSYWSRTLREHEKNYTPYMLEMTAVCSALDHFHEYLWGKKTIVYTDHKPLLGTSTMQKKTINRLVEKMNIFNVELRYKQGTENQGADYLSRRATPAINEVKQSDRYSDLRTKQKEDAMAGAILQFLKHNILPNEESMMKQVLTYAPRCYIDKGVVWFVPPRSPKSKSVFFTPLSMVCQIIKMAHGHPLAGHWGVERTLARIQTSYFWPSMTANVATFIQHCDKCQRSKRLPKQAELSPWQATSRPNERVHVDLFGPLRGDNTYKYVAVITCAFTKWTEVIPIINKEATTVAKAIFEEWICRKGVMKQLVSDGGKEFANQILGELCVLLQIDKHVVSPYHPIANGQVERFNRDMRHYLMTMLDDTTDWVSYLKPLQFAHNTALSKSTRHTPHYLTYLNDPRLPDSLESPTVVTHSLSYTADAFRRLQYAYRLVYKNNEEARKAYTHHFNLRAKSRQFEIGDEVLVAFPHSPKTINTKLSPIWRGPFSVVDFCDKNVLIVRASPRSKNITVHVNRVQLFNHFVDTVTKSCEKVENHQPHLSPADKDDEDDDNDGEPIYDDNVNEILDEHELLDESVNDIVVPPQQLEIPVPPAANRLAQELFGRPATRARGHVPDQVLPNRPLEYRQYPKRKR